VAPGAHLQQNQPYAEVEVRGRGGRGGGLAWRWGLPGRQRWPLRRLGLHLQGAACRESLPWGAAVS
jgi:hypothetical protein